MAAASQNLQCGLIIDAQFELERQLGAGGMGTVWAARDLRLGRSVAIKFLSSDYFHDEQARMRFEREARMAGKIRSPHVVQVFLQGLTGDGIPYVVMEMLDGEDLSSWIARSGSCGLAETAVIVEQVCRALSRAHQTGLVHRDIKPHNIFLSPEAAGQVFVKLLDFGIAKDAGARLKSLTLTGSVIGSVLYISPEQLRDAQSVGPSTDIWALGVVIYQMLTGKVPFDGESLPELFLKIATGRFEPACQVNSGLPREIDAFLQRAIQPALERRFQSAEELAAAFARIVRANTSGVISKPVTAAGWDAVPASIPKIAAPKVSGAAPRSIAAGASWSGGRGRWIALAGLVALLGAGALFSWLRTQSLAEVPSATRDSPSEQAAPVPVPPSVPTPQSSEVRRSDRDTDRSARAEAPPPRDKSHAQSVKPHPEPIAPVPPSSVAPRNSAASSVFSGSSNEARGAAPSPRGPTRNYGF